MQGMNLEQRIFLLEKLGLYITGPDPEWKETKTKAYLENKWFLEEFIELAASNIANRFLKKNILKSIAEKYRIPETNSNPREIGIVMAGNIPLVGFHDLMSVFLSGNKARIKTSKKDHVLVKHIVDKLAAWDERITDLIKIEEMLKGCFAYIATGSNNTSRYFEYYFGKYPHIIRKNRTSVAILKGTETVLDLEKLADDVHFYFGLGCRNVTKIYVPRSYDFMPLLAVFKKYNYLSDHHRYKNNYDYNLALLILNNRYYMTNGSILLVEDPSLFSPISQLNFEYYDDPENLPEKLLGSGMVQCIVGSGFTGFGEAQCPAATDYADGTDTFEFLLTL